MGGCLSKKSTCSSCPRAVPKPTQQIKPPNQVEIKKIEELPVKKEIFIIKHRKSHEIDRRSEEEKDDVKKAPEVVETAKTNLSSAAVSGVFVAAPVRTSSCTKEEVDAILIQCGRLSRSSSTGKVNLSASCGSGENNGNPQRGRKYSGSKRSYDFDNENGSDGRDGDKRKGADGSEDNVVDDDDNGVVGERSHHHRQRQRQSKTVGSPSKGRRRTPSRERDQNQLQRSGSRERGSSGSGRRVSRSPGRRSESPITTSSGVSGANSSSANANIGNGRPGKMVSVPATVSSLAMDKSNNAGGAETISASAVKRIQVKRNAGGGDAAVGARAASPRARSPAKTNVKVLNENQNQQQQQLGSLSRSNSRKAEHSPYRRNPLSEIDSNVVIEQMPLLGTKVSNNVLPQAPIQKPNADYSVNTEVVVQGNDNQISSSKVIAENNLTNLNSKTKEQQHGISEEAKVHQAITSNLAVNVVASGPECLNPQALRNRSSRLSRDFDISPEELSNTSPSYTALLLEDIQNFHQKSTPAISLPPCLSKACSILEAVADLNSSTSSNLSSAFSEDKRRIPSTEQLNKFYDNSSFGAHPAGKKGLETKDTFVQSEVVASDDIMEPSFHKYVTVRRGTLGGEDMEEQESSGSNSFVGGQQYWVSHSSMETNSADSSDCWTSSRSNIRVENQSPYGFQRHAMSEACHDAEEARRRLSAKKRDSDQQQQNGIGRGRIGSRGLLSVPTVTAAAST